MSCITPFIALHAFLWRSEISLTFNKHQVMHGAYFNVPFAEVTCKKALSHTKTQ